jgi:DNA-binding transcriptional LysR family regulator
MGDAALARVGRSRKVVMTMPVFSGVCRVVAESELIALIPRQLAEQLAPSMGLSVYNPPMSIEPALIVGIWHKRSTNNPAHRWMRDLVADIMIPMNKGEKSLPV